MIRVLLIVLCLAAPGLAQVPNAPVATRDVVRPWSLNFVFSQRYENIPLHFGESKPGFMYGPPLPSNHFFDDSTGLSLVYRFPGDRVYAALGYSATIQNGNQTATASMGFRMLELGRRR